MNSWYAFVKVSYWITPSSTIWVFGISPVVLEYKDATTLPVWFPIAGDGEANWVNLSWITKELIICSVLEMNCHPSIAEDDKDKFLLVYPESEESKGAYAANVLTSIPPVVVDSFIITTPSGGFVSKITSENGYVSSFWKGQ